MVTYWIQKPLFNIGWHKWREMSEKRREAITVFFVFIGITFYYAPTKAEKIKESTGKRIYPLACLNPLTRR